MHLPNTSEEFQDLIDKFLEVYGTFGPDDIREELNQIVRDAREEGFDDYDIKQAHKQARAFFVN